ncbi:MAG: response regulator [Candidatus Omnitrophota bacterium]
MSQKILFIDDEADVVEFQKSYLTKRGYTIFTATNTQDALETIKNESLDLAFCDIKLENTTSGFDILTQAKKLKPNLTVYLITGYLDKDVEDKGLALGAKEVLHKPFSLEDLEQKIKESIPESR